jgi:hypothetical protein
MVDKIADKTLGTIIDPFMWFALLVIGLLGGLLWYVLKNIVNKSLVDLFTGQREYNATLATAITLLEMIVYGKGGKK